MKNKELYREKINKEITDVVLSGKGVTFLFNDGKITIEDIHEQDCCEEVYAEWSIIEYHKSRIIGKSFDNLIIKSVKDMGFVIDLSSSLVVEKILVPCYNIQNGYYNSDLTLLINGNIKIDISDLTEGMDK